MSKKYQPLGIGMTPSKTELGEFLRFHRLKLGLRQTQIAELTGIPQSYYSALETGKFKPKKPEYLKSISKVLQCEPRQLQTLTLDKPESGTELGRLMQAWRKQLGLTPKEFAESFKIKLSTILAIENGIRHSIPDCLIGPLVNALNLKPSAFKNYVGRKERTTDSKLGQLIRTRRKELGLSQIRLAKKLQIDRQFLSQIELGQCPLSENNAMVERLAAVLELNLSDLQAVRPKSRKSLCEIKAIMSVRLSKQDFENLRKIKEISGIKDDDSEAINKALELLRQLLEKSI